MSVVSPEGPCDRQRGGGPMSIGTEITLATIIQLALTAGGIVYAWADMRTRALELERRLDKAEASTRDAHTRVAAQQEAFSLYQVQQARELISREVLREVETRIGGHISNVEDRLTQQLGQVRDRLDDLSDRSIPPR